MEILCALIDLKIRRTLERYLPLFGHEYGVVGGAAELVNLNKAMKFGALIVDERLDDAGGFEALVAVRTGDANEQVPVILLSSDSAKMRAEVAEAEIERVWCIDRDLRILVPDLFAALHKLQSA